VADLDLRPMDRAELSRIAGAVFGVEWKARLVEHFAIRRTTLGRWLRDDLVPDWAAAQIRAMAHFPPPPRDTSEEEQFEIGRRLVAERLDQLLEQAIGAGWPFEEVEAMVDAWLENRVAPHPHQGTLAVASEGHP